MTTLCPVCKNALASEAQACPSCGFKLLGATQRFEPISVDVTSLNQPASKQYKAVLHVVRGPQSGVTFSLSDKQLTIGRSPESDIFLNDMTVSRKHALVAPVQGGYMISDENSFNGVWINNCAIDAYILKGGDVIQMGAFSLVYREE